MTAEAAADVTAPGPAARILVVDDEPSMRDMLRIVLRREGYDVVIAKSGNAPPYVNSMWEMQKDPSGGDVVNSYNDGPTEPGKPALGGFYEIETSSPAAALAPGAKLVHVHDTVHFAAGKGTQGMNTIASKVLGLGGRPFEYPEAVTPAAH